MKKLFILSAFVFFVSTFAFAGDSATPVPAKAFPADDPGEDWGRVCSDKQIYDLCNKFLVTRFGEKWAKYYTPYYNPKGIQKNVLIHTQHQYGLRVSYSFSGPANLKELTFIYKPPHGTGYSVGVGPQFTFFMDNVSAEGCGQLKFWTGMFFVAPYDPSKLITAQEATKIAKQKGYDVQFTTLTLIRSDLMLGRLFLWVPGYYAEKGYDVVYVNAMDGTLTRQQAAIPA